jgi:hypothetical protein
LAFVVMREAAMEYLTRLPKALPQDGRVLVHNNVRPARRLLTLSARDVKLLATN